MSRSSVHKFPCSAYCDPPSLRPEKDTEDPGQGTKFKVLGLVLGEDFDSENWRPFFVHDVLEQPEKERHGHLKRSYHGL